jgi:hypothetical protein
VSPTQCLTGTFSKHPIHQWPGSRVFGLLQSFCRWTDSQEKSNPWREFPGGMSIQSSCRRKECMFNRRSCACAGKAQQHAMASAFAKLPVRVLWRLSKSEVQDEDAIADLKLGNNTKARLLNAFPYLFLSSHCLQLLLPTILSRFASFCFCFF